ncbi:MAG: IMS domain-containing protein [Spirulinaceae cyanobacterium]
MRIPLDYYRILGVPIQATAEQLSQAYQDRALQLPRREYSDAAIAARKQLLDEAYGVLSDPEQRSEYDASFLAKTYESNSEGQIDLPLEETGKAENSELDPHTPWIEIDAEQFIGSVLILQELGEYELVLKLGHPYLTKKDGISLDKGLLGDPKLVRADLVLTLALACLELGREHWQQKEYENASISGQTGQDLLLREGLFPGIRGEIQADLYKLRPYRVLELLALPLKNTPERQQGLILLREMLAERGGIDGPANDQSGLSIDDFLRFIQQLRGYLTVAEQQELFEAEAKRPSAVSTYLAVYALLARGFAQRRPALVARAKVMLIRLGKRQDVHLEQAVCALLLGQTEEASRALELSQEYEPLAFIREHSQGAPDLLPGLCLYGENWLHSEVFPHFRDLAQQRVALKDYFADEQVQSYLEKLPAETEDASQWAVVDSQTAHTSVASNSFATQENSAVGSQGGEGISKSRGSASTITVERGSEAARNTPGIGISTLNGGANEYVAPPEERRSRRKKTSHEQPASSFLNPSNGTLKPDSSNTLGSKSSSPKLSRLIFLAIVGLLGLGVAIFLLLGTYKWLRTTLNSLFGVNQPAEESLAIELNKPPVEIPSPGTQLDVSTEGALSSEAARQLISNWLATKSQATGSEYLGDKLTNVLAEPLLSQWRGTVQSLKNNNAYWKYKHEKIEVQSATASETDPNQTSVEAIVTEAADFYQQGQRNETKSYEKDFRVRYNFLRQEDGWRIKAMTVNDSN